jgi:hypothetical protein
MPKVNNGLMGEDLSNVVTLVFTDRNQTTWPEKSILPQQQNQQAAAASAFNTFLLFSATTTKQHYDGTFVRSLVVVVVRIFPSKCYCK